MQMNTMAMAFIQDIIFVLSTFATKPRFDAKGNLMPKQGLVVKTKMK